MLGNTLCCDSTEAAYNRSEPDKIGRTKEKIKTARGGQDIARTVNLTRWAKVILLTPSATWTHKAGSLESSHESPLSTNSAPTTLVNLCVSVNSNAT